MYRVEWNTGDYNWDNNPEIERYETIEEVKKAIKEQGEDITKEQIAEIENGKEVFDKTEEVWMVVKERA